MIKKEQIKTMGKAQLIQLLFGIPREEVRVAINLVISDSRKISENEAKKMKLILKHEVIKVLIFFGFEIV